MEETDNRKSRFEGDDQDASVSNDQDAENKTMNLKNTPEDQNTKTDDDRLKGTVEDGGDGESSQRGSGSKDVSENERSENSNDVGNAECKDTPVKSVVEESQVQNPTESMEINDLSKKSEDSIDMTTKTCDTNRTIDDELTSNAKTNENHINTIFDNAIENAVKDNVKNDATQLKRQLENDGDSLPRKRLRSSVTPKPNVAPKPDSLPLTNGLCHDKNAEHSEDSEKENSATVPMDLTANKQDVIMLSDSDDEMPMTNGHDVELSLDEMISRRKLIKQFQSQLRNEEAKLVLLKKLRNSQLSTYHNTNTPEQARALSAKAQNAHVATHQQRPGHPPPLIRGQQTQQGSTKQMIPYRSQTGRMNVPNQQQQQQPQQQQQQPPPLVMAQRSNQPAAPQRERPPAPVNTQPRETPAQRQAAAKLALRKQLEKTLLQIPPPKPPPPEMNFIPSLAGTEFIILIGLEEVVNYITDANLIAKGRKNPNERLVCTPFSCVQCQTDYTPVWKREKPGSKNVICELCVTTNQKKALKHEHTNRLKSAFVKALQQEQEIERMQASSTPPSSTPAAAPAPAPAKPTEHVQRHNYHAAAAAHQLHQQQQVHMRSSPQPNASVLQNFAAAAAANRTFPFQLGMGQLQKPTDLQRQYLLDMIPTRGLQPGALHWKGT